MTTPRKFFDFAEFREHVLSLYLGYYPTIGSILGLHEYDALVEDYSAPRREEYLYDIRCALTILERDFFGASAAHVPSDDLTRFECRMIEWKLRDEIFHLTELKEFEWNPMSYSGQLELNHLIDRDFAPLTERMRSVLARLRAFPRVLAVARQNLGSKLDRTIVETGIESLEGILQYLDQLPAKYEGKIEDPALALELLEAIASARLAVSSFLEAVRTVVLPNAMYDSFRLGKELFERFVQSSELVTDSLETLLDKGRREMDRLTLELYQASEELDSKLTPREAFHTYIESEHFSEQTILSQTESMLERIRTYLIQNNIVAIPSEIRCTVKETPAHMRWAFAAMDSPGAFEKVATEAFYYVTLPEASWDEAKRKEFLHGLNRSILEIISIHEAYPGHYVHFLHIQKSKSKIGKCFMSYAFIEGWAHYTEEMMLEQGWGSGDARIRMAYLQEALVRVARYIAAIELHSRTMTLSEAQHLFEEKALLRPHAARREAERGVFDPGYLFYLLGKMQIKELRAKQQRAEGEDFSLFEFHNQLLSHGSPPVKIVGEMMEG
jgi:uncharacterized protein (DUF885 family)